jgi:hypothetical protein
MTDAIETYRGRNGWRYRYAGRDDGDYMSEAMARQAGELYAHKRPTDREMLDECEAMIRADGGPTFSEWEHEFLVSVNAALLDGKPLSEQQRAKLDQLWRHR